jgi:hypothetical protein
MQLNPIRLLVKEFLQAITRFNLDINELVVQGVLEFITKKMVAEMFYLPQSNIIKILAKPAKEKEKERKKETKVSIYRIIAPLDTLMD